MEVISPGQTIHDWALRKLSQACRGAASGNAEVKEPQLPSVFSPVRLREPSETCVQSGKTEDLATVSYKVQSN